MRQREDNRTENRAVRRKRQQQASEATAQDPYPTAAMMAVAAALYAGQQVHQDLRPISTGRNDGMPLEMPISMTVLMGPDGSQTVPLDVDIMH